MPDHALQGNQQPSFHFVSVYSALHVLRLAIISQKRYFFSETMVVKIKGLTGKGKRGSERRPISQVVFVVRSEQVSLRISLQPLGEMPKRLLSSTGSIYVERLSPLYVQLVQSGP